jgi:hypothetical protein
MKTNSLAVAFTRSCFQHVLLIAVAMLAVVALSAQQSKQETETDSKDVRDSRDLRIRFLKQREERNQLRINELGGLEGRVREALQLNLENLKGRIEIAQLTLDISKNILKMYESRSSQNQTQSERDSRLSSVAKWEKYREEERVKLANAEREYRELVGNDGSTPLREAPPPLEKTIQQTLSSGVKGAHPDEIRFLQSSNSIRCKVLTVGPNGTSLATITLYGPDATSYPDGTCACGATIAHTMFRVASGNPEYKWIGAWVMPGNNPKLYFHRNGQIAYAVTSRTWLDLNPGRISVDADTVVQLDSGGNIIQAWSSGGKTLFPDKAEQPLPKP